MGVPLFKSAKAGSEKKLAIAITVVQIRKP